MKAKATLFSFSGLPLPENARRTGVSVRKGQGSIRASYRDSGVLRVTDKVACRADRKTGKTADGGSQPLEVMGDDAETYLDILVAEAQRLAAS